MPTAFPNIKQWPSPEGYWPEVQRRGKWLMMSDTGCATAFIDLTRRSPKAKPNHSEYVNSFDILPDGRIVVSSMLTKPPRKYAIRIHPADWPTKPTAGVLEEYPNPSDMLLAKVWSVSGCIIAFDFRIERSNPVGTHQVYFLDRGKFVAAPGLPTVTSFGRDPFDYQVHTNGKVTLPTGEEILIWDGDGYTWNGKRFELSWKLGVKEPGGIEGWMSVPWGADGFFYLSERQVTYVRRGKRPVRVHPDAGSVTFLSPGPEDSIILCMFKNAKRHIARVWFPADGTYIPLFRVQLGWRPSTLGGDPLYWNKTAKHIHISPLTTFPDSDLLGLKRIKPPGKGYQIPKG